MSETYSRCIAGGISRCPCDFAGVDADCVMERGEYKRGFSGSLVSAALRSPSPRWDMIVVMVVVIMAVVVFASTL